jgi:hypothetical protein
LPLAQSGEEDLPARALQLGPQRAQHRRRWTHGRRGGRVQHERRDFEAAEDVAIEGGIERRQVRRYRCRILEVDRAGGFLAACRRSQREHDPGTE